MSPSELNDLLRAPAESVGVELKSWLDPIKQDDQAKIAKELIALRNADGGVLIFGFDDKTLLPTDVGRPASLEVAFHPDIIQSLLREFSSPTFEVKVVVGEMDGTRFPAIIVPAGVQSPSITRRPYPATGKLILRHNALYVRSISQGVVESTEPRSRDDWDRLIQVCFDNREADIGKFFRRHLGPITEQLLNRQNTDTDRSALQTGGTILNEPSIPYGRFGCLQVLEDGAKRYLSVVQQARLKDGIKAPTDRKGWREIAVAVSGPVRTIPVADLLGELFSRHPRLSGWPAWVDSRGHAENQSHPYVLDRGWQALVQSGRREVEPAINFWRLEPRGNFYLCQTLEDDLVEQLGEQRGKVLDFVLVVLRAAEALATAHGFARILSAAPDDNSMEVAFRWRGLENRELVSWVEPSRDFWTASKSRQSEVTVELTVPLETSRTALATYVAKAVKPVFEIFGFNASIALIEEVAGKVLTKR